MKTIVTVLVCLLLLCVGIIWVGVDELYSENRVLRSEVKGLREQNHFLLRRNGQLQIENDTFRKALDSAKIQFKH